MTTMTQVTAAVEAHIDLIVQELSGATVNEPESALSLYDLFRASMTVDSYERCVVAMAQVRNCASWNSADHAVGELMAVVSTAEYL